MGRKTEMSKQWIKGTLEKEKKVVRSMFHDPGAISFGTESSKERKAPSETALPVHMIDDERAPSNRSSSHGLTKKASKMLSKHSSHGSTTTAAAAAASSFSKLESRDAAESVAKSPKVKQHNILMTLGIATSRDGQVNVTAYCSAPNELNGKEEFVHIAMKKLSKIAESEYCSIFPFGGGIWYVKCYDHHIYFLKAPEHYPKYLAVEALDTLSNIYTVGFQLQAKNYEDLNEYCKAVFNEYGSTKGENRNEKTAEMLHQLDSIKDEMGQNIDYVLQNMEKAEDIQLKTEELVELSMAFKKKTSELKRKMWLKEKGTTIVAAGTGAAVAIGATIGFLVGGPGGAAFITLPSVAAAEFLEVCIIATACGAGYYATATAAIKTWFWSQKMVHVK